MVQPTSIDILNQLLALHMRSLPMYLMSAKPWTSGDDAECLEALEHIASDQELMANRIAAVIREHGGTVTPSEFPMQFTDMHDLSLSYLIPAVEERQEREILFMRDAISQLRDAPAPRAITEEALGAAQAHLDSLREVCAKATA